MGRRNESCPAVCCSVGFGVWGQASTERCEEVQQLTPRGLVTGVVIEERRRHVVRPVLHHTDQLGELPPRLCHPRRSHLTPPRRDTLGVCGDGVYAATLTDA